MLLAEKIIKHHDKLIRIIDEEYNGNVSITQLREIITKIEKGEC